MSDAMTLDAIDLEDLDFWVGPRSRIEQSFATLRAERPRAFFQERGVDGRRFGADGGRGNEDFVHSNAPFAVDFLQQ